MPKVEAYIGIGSNLGDRRDFCSRALGLLGLLPRSVLTGYSFTYETEAVGDVGGPFLNLVAKVETELPAERLLEILLETERGLGRTLNERQGPRTIDLDLLFYGDQVIKEPGPDGLILPPGFHASVVADGLGPIRHMALRGHDIYVSTRHGASSPASAAVRPGSTRRIGPRPVPSGSETNGLGPAGRGSRSA